MATSGIRELPVASHGNLIQSLAEAIADRILLGEFKEGDPITQESIAQDYAISRTPVREALRRVEAWGFIEHRPNRGVVVRSIPTEQIAELYDVRALLETDLLARSIPRMRDANVDAARAILPLLEKAYEENDIAAWSELNWRFHEALYASSGREQTIGMVATINRQLERYVRLHLILLNAFEVAKDEHRELVKLCATRDVGRAVTYLEAHIREAGHGLLRAIEEKRHQGR
jgi:DNA-binding GntR family transcriptional regulator